LLKVALFLHRTLIAFLLYISIVQFLLNSLIFKIYKYTNNCSLSFSQQYASISRGKLSLAWIFQVYITSIYILTHA